MILKMIKIEYNQNQNKLKKLQRKFNNNKLIISMMMKIVQIWNKLKNKNLRLKG